MTNEVLGRGSARSDWKTAAFIAVLSNLPDLDIAAGLLVYGNGSAFHRGPTHSIAFALLAAILAANVWRLWPAIPRMNWTSSFFVILAHVIGDLLFTKSFVSLLWPFEIYWAAGASGWGESLMPIIFEAHKDAGIVLVCLLTIILVRLAATVKEQTPSNLLNSRFSGARRNPRRHGPQLNNYRELVPLIRKADETQADPLTEHEARIIARIAKAFPGDQKIYGATHKEQAYTSKKNGELIPYTDAESINAL